MDLIQWGVGRKHLASSISGHQVVLHPQGTLLHGNVRRFRWTSVVTEARSRQPPSMDVDDVVVYIIDTGRCTRTFFTALAHFPTGSNGHLYHGHEGNELVHVSRIGPRLSAHYDF